MAGHKIGAGEIEAVFEHWKEVMDSPRSKLDVKRRNAIADRLKDGYTLADLCDAVNGCRASRFHMGENDKHRTYNDIALICRDAEHVDRFIEDWETVSKRAAVLEAKKATEPKALAEMTTEERESARDRVRSVLALVRGKAA